MALGHEATPAVMQEPSYGYTKDGLTPYKPTLREIVAEWVDAANFSKDANRALIALNFGFHVATAFMFVIYLLRYMSTHNLVFAVFALIFIGTVYNTIWYHRYCSHSAFQFSRPVFNLIFLWTTPLFFRESTYAIPHRVHHQVTEKPGDPYGPHLGWLGTYLAIDSSMKLNVEVTEHHYNLMKRSVAHIGFRMNDCTKYKKTGSIENVPYYLAKTSFAQLFWSGIIFTVAGPSYVVAWYAAIFVATALIRDFNWRGHGGNFRQRKKLGWEFDRKSYALNQHFYGYIASEWHDNHHKYPFSANNGFLPGQIDLAFQLIKFLKTIGVVESFIDARPTFEKECLRKATST